MIRMMKYVIYQDSYYYETPILFPLHLDYSAFSFLPKIVAAGLVRIKSENNDISVEVIGQADSLGIKNREDIDSKIILDGMTPIE